MYKILQRDYEQLNREHVTLATAHIVTQSELETAQEHGDALQEQVGALRDIVAGDRAHAEAAVAGEMDALAARNVELVAANAGLHETIHTLEGDIELLSDKLLMAREND